MAWRKIYLFILAVLLILLTVLLSAAAVRIWQEGSVRKAENPLAAVYTPENVAAELHRISPLIYTVIGMAAAGVFIVLGVLNGSMEDVLRKAINLCTECIGLG